MIFGSSGDKLVYLSGSTPLIKILVRVVAATARSPRDRSVMILSMICLIWPAKRAPPLYSFQ